MADQNLCLRNKFGYCKFGQKCQLKHNNELCSNGYCSVKSCDKRHPKNCWWFNQFGRCKFTFCAYKHAENGIQTDLTAKIEALEVKIKEKDYELKIQLSKIKEIEESLKYSELENRVKQLETYVLTLQEKLESTEKEDYYVTKWSPGPEGGGWTVLDPLVRRKSFEYQCDECDYIGRNSVRLKLHKEVKHMYYCTQCKPYENQLFKTEEELKTHTLMVHVDLEKVLTQEEFDNLSENDLEVLRTGGSDTPRRQDARKKYDLRKKKLKL